MRLLSQRRHHDRKGVHGQKPQSHTSGNRTGHVGRSVPLLHQRADAASYRALWPGARAMNRREFLQASGALIVSFRLSGPLNAQQGPIQGTPPLNQVDSWLAIAADGSITAYSGKEELGQGISTAQIQLVAEELSVPFKRVNLIYCDTAVTPDQAHTSGSQSHPANFNHSNLAQAGATAREALLRLAADRFQVPVDRLTAAQGVIS